MLLPDAVCLSDMGEVVLSSRNSLQLRLYGPYTVTLAVCIASLLGSNCQLFGKYSDSLNVQLPLPQVPFEARIPASCVRAHGSLLCAEGQVAIGLTTSTE